MILHRSGLILSESDLKPENKGMDPLKAHLTDFNISKTSMEFHNHIEFLDDNGHTHYLKTRGCIKKRKYRRIKRRSIF